MVTSFSRLQRFVLFLPTLSHFLYTPHAAVECPVTTISVPFPMDLTSSESTLVQSFFTPSATFTASVSSFSKPLVFTTDPHTPPQDDVATTTHLLKCPTIRQLTSHLPSRKPVVREPFGQRFLVTLSIELQ